VHKNVTNLMVRTVSELESRVKNYRGKTKKQKDGSACMCQVGGRWSWEVARGCWGVTRKIRMTTLTRERVFNMFKYKVRAQRDCDSLCK
jgi:hypothetical protein